MLNPFTKTEIYINLTHEGLHCWPNAFEEVAFLQHPHRHNFNIHMRKRVFHDDRDVEFIHWKHQVQKYLKTLPFDLGSMSCEMFARDLFDRFDCTYVSVDEDGEAGAAISDDTALQLKLAWLAGILDGEGSIHIHRRKSKNENGFVYACSVFIGNTDKNMIDLVAKILEDIGVRRCPTIYQTKLKSWKQMHNITVSRREEIVQLLERIYPYLVTKKERAELMLKWCKSRLEQESQQPNHNKLVWTEEDTSVYDKMKLLNRRGRNNTPA